MSKNLLISADAVAKPPRGAEIAAHVPADPPVSSDAVAKSPHGAGADGEYDTNPLASIELYSQKWEVRDKVNYTPSPPPFFMHKIFEQSMPNLDVLIDFNTMHFENTRWNDEFDARHHGLHAILTKLDTRGVKFDVLASSTNLPWLESCMYPFFLHIFSSFEDFCLCPRAATAVAADLGWSNIFKWFFSFCSGFIRKGGEMCFYFW